MYNILHTEWSEGWGGQELRIIRDFLEFINLEKKIPRVKLLITGDGPQEKNIRAYIKNQGVSGKVIMTGYREDVPQILKSLDLVVLPSYSNEGVPQGVLQAMALGTQVLSTRAGGIEEVVKNGQTGTIVPARDGPALSEAVYWVYQNRGESQRMAANARKFILNHFTAKTMTNKSEQVYREVLESDHRVNVASLVDNKSLRR